MTHILISTIRTDGGTQAREKLDPATLQRYVDLLREAKQEGMEPVWPFKTNVDAYYDGSNYWLVDGFHRVAACKEVDIDAVQADVAQGTQRDAILKSFSANSDHGLPSSSEDKRRSVKRMLMDEEWGKWSDREIARRCKVSHPTVATLRKELAEVTGKFTSERAYTNKNGNQATMKTAAIGGYGSVKPEIVSYDDDEVYAWLRGYEDEMGRRWRDLEDTQVHHANSPCYQAYVQAFPGQADPKLLLKRTLYRLQREQRTALAFPPLMETVDEPSQEKDERYLEIWEVEGLVKNWHATRPPIRADALYDLEAFCDWLQRNDYNTRRNYAKQALNNVKNRYKRVNSHYDHAEASPAQTAYARSEVRHAIAGANRDACRMFPAESPAFFYHGWADMGETHPQYHFLRTAVADYPADVVAEELADLCRCNPVPQDPDDFLDRAIANEAKEIEEMLLDDNAVVEAPDQADGNEWYTPTWLIEKAKAVMGGIDIDPASAPAAQERVQATRWYGKDHMGLGTGSLNINWVHHNGPHWAPARVWLNPPYSFPLVGQFVEKLLEQIEKGYVGEAILLTNNNTETDWWHKAAAAAAVTFTFRSRVFFWRPGQEDATSPRQGQTAFYFGDNALEFIETFKDKGMSFMRWDTSAFNEEE